MSKKDWETIAAGKARKDFKNHEDVFFNESKGRGQTNHYDRILDSYMFEAYEAEREIIKGEDYAQGQQDNQVSLNQNEQIAQ